jgi:hypothetical protein
MPASANAPAAGPMQALNDWSRPIRVSRFGVLLDKAGGDPFANLTSLGRMVWPDGKDVDPAATLPGWPANSTGVLTEVLAAYDATSLYVRVICDEPRPDRMRLDSPDLWRNDHMAVCIDPRHDHWRFCQLTVLPDGRLESVWKTVHTGYVPADLAAREEPGPADVAARAQRSADRWIVDVTVRWAALGVEDIGAGRCVGLNVSRWRTVGCEHLMQWSPTFGLVHDARCFGDLYLGAPAAILQEIQLGGPNWGPNHGYAKFVASRPFQAWVEADDSTEPIDPQPISPQANQYGLAGCPLRYRIDPRDILRGRMTLKWTGAPGPGHGGTSSASFVFGWKRSVLLTHAAGRGVSVSSLAEDGDMPVAPGLASLAGGSWHGTQPGGGSGHRTASGEISRQGIRHVAQPPRPEDGAARDFFARMCDYLLTRLPGLRREGGRYLVSDDGLRIDLLGPDPLAPMAQAVAERVDGQADQLAACALVLCQPQVLISSGSRARASACTNPGSVLWTGGTFCDTYSMILAELVDRLAALRSWTIRTGLVYMLRPEGASFEWPNHYWAGVWLDRGVTILDAELGRFFYRRDGRTLATLDDMFEDPSLAEASGIGLGDYFRLHTRADVVIRGLARWREVRPA